MVLQFHRDEPVSRLRRRWSPLAHLLQRIGVGIFVAIPLLIVFRVPHLAVVSAVVAIAAQLIPALA